MQAFNLPRLNESIAYHPDLKALDQINWHSGISFVNYGVKIGIRVSESRVLSYLRDYLPLGWKPSSTPVVDELYSLMTSGTDYQLYRHSQKIAQTSALEEVLEIFNSDLCLQVGLLVQDKLFVHAGVVGWRGRAIVIPGRSFSGKTTLVAALVKAGATYYSDEYAVIDRDGLVHPYPRLLCIRERVGEQIKRRKCSVEELGGRAGTEPLPVGLVVQTKYQSDAQWQPKTISPGQAALALFDNTIVAKTRPHFALPILSSAVAGALAIKSKRGEASDVAVALLKQLNNWIE